MGAGGGRKLMARRFRAAAAATLVFATLSLQTASAQTPTSGDQKVTWIWGDTSEPSSLNPFKGYLATDFYMWAWTYHLPIGFTLENLGAVPDFVTDVETSEDLQTFTYTVRDDLRWSDGEPMTANDMAFTLNLYKDKHAYIPQGYLGNMESAEAIDDTTVVVRTTTPTSLYSGTVPYLYTYILPEHVWQEYADQPKAYDNLPAVGSGPFFFAEYERGQFVRLERNPHWSGPEPRIDEVIFRIFENEDALAEALKQGEIDFANIDSPNVFDSLEGEPNIETYNGVRPEFDEIAMNNGSSFQAPDPPFQPHGDGHPALQDPVVRRAIRMAIDSEELVERVSLGYYEAGTTVVPPVTVPGARWVPEGDELLSFDLEGANQLLDDAGYMDTDGDGVREMPGGGEPLIFRYYTQTNDQNTIRTAPFVKSWLEDIGIQADVTAMSSGRLGDEINAGTYDLFHWGWVPDADPDSILQNWTCGDRPPNAQTYGDNDAYYCNPEYDRMYAEQHSTLDPERRFEIIHEMQRLFYNEAPYAVLWYPSFFQAYRTDTFTGYQPQPAARGDLLDGFSRDVVLLLRPVSGGAGSSSTEARGISALVWIGMGVAVLLLLVVMLLLRRRGGAEDRA
jgi:peptide/nickel transport system substrate-binding protein